jgi:hypothetical protein
MTSAAVVPEAGGQRSLSHGGAGRCRTLRSRSWSDIRVAVDGCAAGCPAWHCRRVCTTLPPSRVSAAPGACGCRCPPAASTVQASGPSLSAGCADLARNPSRCPRNRTPRPCPRCGWACGRMLAGRPRSTGGHGRSPEHGRGHRGRRSPTIHARRPATLVGSGRRLPTLPGCPSACGTAATWRCRPDGWTAAAERVSGRLRHGTRQASAVHRCVRNHSRCPDGRCPPGTLPQSAGIGGYRNRSPARRPLDGCRHRRYARAS